jgi:hypothetical protein
MAQNESDREDLLREATALTERIEYQVDGESIVSGFRSDGSGSLFLGVDPVYQFNRRGELRRAYWRGLLVKAEQGNLVSLRRHRTDDEVQLLRHDLSDVETQEFLEEARMHLARTLQRIQSADCQIVGQVPPDGSVDQRVQAWLIQRLDSPLVIARSPRAG